MKLFYIDRINDHVPGDFESIDKFLMAVSESLNQTTELSSERRALIRKLLSLSLLEDSDASVVVLRSENSLILTAFNDVVNYYRPMEEIERKPVFDLEIRLCPDEEELNPQSHIPTEDVYDCLQLSSIKRAVSGIRQVLLEEDGWSSTEKPFEDQEEPSHRRIQMFTKESNYIFLSYVSNERQPVKADDAE